MSYALVYSGGTIGVPVGTTNTTTSLTFIGRNWASANVNEGYGQVINQNYLSLLENFAAYASGPPPATLVKGQLWYDDSTQTLKVNSANGSAAWLTLAKLGSVTTTEITTGGATIPGLITGAWRLTAGSTLNATYADLAEFYAIDSRVEPGTVVEFGGAAEITRCDSDASRRVAGVISTNPAFVMNTPSANIERYQPVALQGRVPCKVIGRVELGDMMVSAGNGCARGESDPKSGSVIGKSLARKITDGIEIIEIAVGRL